MQLLRGRSAMTNTSKTDTDDCRAIGCAAYAYDNSVSGGARSGASSGARSGTSGSPRFWAVFPRLLASLALEALLWLPT